MGIIDINVKIEVLKEGGAAGADILLTQVLMKVEQNRLNTYIEIVQKAFEKKQNNSFMISSKRRMWMNKFNGLTLHMYV